MAAVIQKVMVMSGVSRRLMAKKPARVVRTSAAFSPPFLPGRRRRASIKTKVTVPKAMRAEGKRAAHSLCPKICRLKAVNQ
ncbi:hypothetical protein GCM10023213_28290 [Prosthecobacter algae]|uniref:Uncharacterized protein n=1 Tax=Prosthecobacter algae TaxID=1144682 RepID=A0ABP9PA33_9BACT